MQLLTFLAATISCLLILTQKKFEPPPETPRSIDPRLEVTLFAQQPDIVHPIALTFDRKGRLLVIESHTHFRPPNYAGPPHDRIRMLEDTDGDGKADKFTTFFEGTRSTMDIATHPDGSIYLATRNEILRLTDTTGKGIADKSERIVFLDTKGDYPHNGLSGLCFDHQGNLFFGMGENLGAGYKIIGSEGTTLAGGGEGGNIFCCTAKGAKLRRYATGFWNPFGIHIDSFGRVIAVDNDPDSMPPCRMVHVVDGGDYGYQFRYGRSGRHVFQAWNGQLPGTLPMICGTGEAPCEVLCYESSGLPTEYFGNYFVTAWADHRLERYELKERGASYTAEQKILIQGGKNFRPTGLAVASDGSLFIADWVLPDYTLHNKGAIWHVRPKTPLQFQRESLETLQKKFKLSQGPGISTQIASNLAITALKLESDIPALLNAATHADPFVAHTARMHLANSSQLLDAIKIDMLPPAQRVAVLLAERASGNAKYVNHLTHHLQDASEDVRFLAAKWVSDETLKQFRPEIESALKSPQLSVRMTMAYATALARLSDQEVSESKLAERFARQLQQDISDDNKVQLLKLIPPSHPELKLNLLRKLASSSSPELQQEVALALCLHPKTERLAALQEMAKNSNLSQEAKNLALMGLSTTKPQPPSAELIKQRPSIENQQAWLDRYGSGGNAAAGRRVFYHPQGVGCFRCHQIDGRGSEIGPDLSTIGRTEPLRILESILQPSATVAPHYQAWTLVMHDGRTLNGILVRTYLDEYTYLDADGKPFTIKTHDIADTKASPKSIMPEGLLNQLNDQEVRDLLAYLFSRK